MQILPYKNWKHKSFSIRLQNTTDWWILHYPPQGKIDINKNIGDHELEITVTNKKIIIFYDKIIPTGR